jgi:NAD(P)-dependent dehydrogenase (short-subunit alcohol dehydrogenase family)
MNDLTGKVVLISGGARGIGAQAARRMSEAGAAVVIGDVLDDQGRTVASEIEAAGGRASYLGLDVSAEESWQAAIDHTVSTYGKLDVLVNNAGIFVGKSIEDVELEAWHRLVAVNLTGVFLGTRIAAPALREAGANSPKGSAIINLSSIAGLVGSMLDPLYSMTKGGVTTFTKSTALYFGRRGDPIRVNAVHPGVIETDMGEQTFQARAEQTRSNDIDAARAAGAASHALGRLGTADEVAQGIVFLASDDASFMTGSSLVVDGGLTAA